MKGHRPVLVDNLNGLNAWCKATVLRLKNGRLGRTGAVSLAHAELDDDVEWLDALFRGDIEGLLARLGDPQEKWVDQEQDTGRAHAPGSLCNFVRTYLSQPMKPHLTTWTWRVKR
jgi:hypothetical protein